MSSSLVKFMDQLQDGNNTPLSWNRADLDGAPFRGTNFPLVPEDEMENRLVRIADPFVQIFDMSDETHSEKYRQVVDKIINGWARCLFVKRIITRNKNTDAIRVRIWMEWAEVYMVDGKPLMSQSPYLGRPND